MRSFKKGITVLASLLCVVLLVVTVESASSYYLRPVSWADYFNHDMDRLEASGEPVDMVFVGSSRTLVSFVPSVFEETLGAQNVVNAAVSGQPIEGSYYQLAELIDRFHPSCAVVGVTWNAILKSSTNLQARLITGDHLQQLPVRIAYVINCFKLEELPYLLASYRFRSNLTTAQINKNVLTRQNLAATDYQGDPTKTNYYVGNGYVSYNSSVETGSLPVETLTFSENNIEEEALRWLDKIVELCDENDVTLYLVSGVTSVERTLSIQDYDGAVRFYENYAEENGLFYCNLNYLKGRETFLPDNLMKDVNHTNHTGSLLVSALYAEILEKNMAGEDTTDYFYADMDEFSADIDRIVAAEANMTISENEDSVQLALVCRKPENRAVEYRVQLCYGSDGEFVTVSDYGPEEQRTIDLPNGLTDCTLRVCARTPGSDAEWEAYHEYDMATVAAGADEKDASEE